MHVSAFNSIQTGVHVVLPVIDTSYPPPVTMAKFVPMPPISEIQPSGLWVAGFHRLTASQFDPIELITVDAVVRVVS